MTGRFLPQSLGAARLKTHVLASREGRRCPTGQPCLQRLVCSLHGISPETVVNSEAQELRVSQAASARHDFPPLGQGKAIPYGTYDVAQNQALVNVGMSHDTAEFAVASIRR